ncbi:hypothetical protein PENTCL1PPCAC_4247, partial [Pristionchus entomophagus]
RALLMLSIIVGVMEAGRRFTTPRKEKEERRRLHHRYRHQAEEEDYDNDEEDANSDTQIITRMLNGSGYDWRVRPPGINLTIPGNHGPVVVDVNMLLRSISKIDDVNMEYSVQLTFREEWIDARLAYGIVGAPDYLTLPDFVILPAGEQIWMPDTFFMNEKTAQRHTIDKPNVMIRVHKNGTILYSVRISLTLSCPMHLQDYPMDMQRCNIEMGSYAYTTDDIEYMWKRDTSMPVQLKPGLAKSLPSFQLVWFNTSDCTSVTSTGVYGCLKATLELKRQFSYYLLQLYIPSTMLVIVSWVSFWLDRSAVPARVTLGVTTLLTMTTQASGINAKLPPVSYTKAIDIWIGACLMFIFGALLEFAFVTYISSRNFYRTSRMDAKATLVPEAGEQPLIISNNHMDARMNEVWIRQQGMDGPVYILANRRQSTCDVIKSFLHRLVIVKWIRSKLYVNDKAKRADLLSRITFPTLFFLFNIAYWWRYYEAEKVRTMGYYVTESGTGAPVKTLLQAQ